MIKKLLILPELTITRICRAERRTTWLELFFDLVFAAAVYQLGLALYNNLTPVGLLKFLALFLPTWWCWCGAINFNSRFELNEGLNRSLTFLEIVLVSGMTLCIGHAYGATFTGYTLAYMAIRLLLVAKYALAGRHYPSLKPMAQRLTHGFVVGVAIWSLSLLMPANFGWLRYSFWLLGVGWDLAIIFKSTALMRNSLPNFTHLPERFGLFTLIVLGEAVSTVISNVTQSMPTSSQIPPITLLLTLTSGILGLIIAFGLWWLYFDEIHLSGLLEEEKCLNMSALNTWIFSHGVLAMSLAALSVGVKTMVLADPAQPVTAFALPLILGATSFALLTIGVIHLSSLAIEKPIRLKICVIRCVSPGLLTVLLASVLIWPGCCLVWGWPLVVLLVIALSVWGQIRLNQFPCNPF